MSGGVELDAERVDQLGILFADEARLGRGRLVKAAQDGDGARQELRKERAVLDQAEALLAQSGLIERGGLERFEANLNAERREVRLDDLRHTRVLGGSGGHDHVELRAGHACLLQE